MILKAYAKINWSLDITGQREDGYHIMDMLMQPVSLADEISLSPAASLSITTGGWPRSRADESKMKPDIPGAPGSMWINGSRSVPVWAAAVRMQPLC